MLDCGLLITAVHTYPLNPGEFRCPAQKYDSHNAVQVNAPANDQFIPFFAEL